MSSQNTCKFLLISIISSFILAQVHAGLLDRLILLMMKNATRRRNYVPFPLSLSPFTTFGNSLNYPLSLPNLANSIGNSMPYSQYLASLASYGGLPPIAPLGPWGGINPFFPYFNLAEYPDYRSLPALTNYLGLSGFPAPLYPPPLTSNALNASDPKNDKKLTPRNAAGLVYNIHDADRKKVFADNLKLLSDPRIPPSFRSPLLFPELTEGLIDSLR